MPSMAIPLVSTMLSPAIAPLVLIMSSFWTSPSIVADTIGVLIPLDTSLCPPMIVTPISEQASWIWWNMAEAASSE